MQWMMGSLLLLLWVLGLISLDSNSGGLLFSVITTMQVS